MGWNFKVEKGMQKGTWRIWSIDVNRVFDDILRILVCVL